MTAVVLDGRAMGQRWVEETAQRVRRLGLAPPPTLAIVVADTPDAVRNLGIKRRWGADAGVDVRVETLPATVTTAMTVDRVARLGADLAVDGVFLQFPFPPSVDGAAVAAVVPVARDVDGAGPDGAYPPAAVTATLAALADIGPLAGRRVTLVGPPDGRDDRGPLPGYLAALAAALVGVGAAVVRTAAGDDGWLVATAAADIVVTAIGEPGCLRGAALRPGAVVVDGGTSRVDGRVVGDVDRSTVEATAAVLVPMPGGVGPLTVAALIDHVVSAAQARRLPAGPAGPAGA